MAEMNNDEMIDEQNEQVEPRKRRIEVGGQIKTFEETTPNKALKQLKSIINDYEDYQTVPNRRKSDAQFRDFAMNSLGETNDNIKEIHAMLIEKQQMSAWAVADQVINDIAIFAQDIERSDYGFTTFFENPKLLEMDISQLYVIDFEFVETLVVLRERTDSFMSMVSRNYFEDTDLWFETLNRVIGRLIRLIDDRAKLISSYERISY